jgi:hypothetical protein
VASFLPISLPRTYMYICSPPYVPHALSISFLAPSRCSLCSPPHCCSLPSTAHSLQSTHFDIARTDIHHTSLSVSSAVSCGSVGTVTRLRTGRLWIRFSVEAKSFCPIPKFQTGSRVHSASNSMCNGRALSHK